MKLLREKPVATLEGLLERMSIGWGSNKTSAILHYLASPRWVWISEVYEHRHMTTSGDDTEVALDLFLESRESGYLIGKPEWGSRSTIDFVITPLGIERYEQLRAERLAKEKADAENKPQE